MSLDFEASGGRLYARDDLCAQVAWTMRDELWGSCRGRCACEWSPRARTCRADKSKAGSPTTRPGPRSVSPSMSRLSDYGTLCAPAVRTCWAVKLPPWKVRSTLPSRARVTVKMIAHWSAMAWPPS